jgi:hypothetical protein
MVGVVAVPERLRAATLSIDRNSQRSLGRKSSKQTEDIAMSEQHPTAIVREDPQFACY